ncbi:MAG TPA: YrzE family protein [Ktedonobacteraceae bacterium]|jgi:hypothetical protein|nr:YrzE family protein [Ktedonobacteraceae bacterium]
MQDKQLQSDNDVRVLHDTGDISPDQHEPTRESQPQSNDAKGLPAQPGQSTGEPDQPLQTSADTSDQPSQSGENEPLQPDDKLSQPYHPTQPLTGGSAGAQSSQQLRLSTSRRRWLSRRVSNALIAGIIVGILNALITLLVVFINSGTFTLARQQIAKNQLTVNIALTVIALDLLLVVVGIVIGFFTGFVVGKISVRRRLGFLAGALAGGLYYLILFLVGLFQNYPGNLTVNKTPTSLGSLLVAFLLLCLCVIAGGLISLFGTWVSTIKHPEYLLQTDK